MTKISNQQKEVAKHTASAFLVDKPPIFHFWDDDHISDVYVLEAVNSPQHGVTSYATVGLSDHQLMHQGKDFGTRVEIVGACGSKFPDFGNVLATLAFCVINSKWFCAPGIIFPDVIKMYGHSLTMSDIYFTYPFLWDDRLKSARLSERDIAWLLAVPISKEESAFAQEFGSKKLEELFSEKDIDIYNLNRPSVV
ncbi:suppressor of fused domain protein [Parvibium lacunae]|uniref:Suppressor of fused domain protein n=1 Tax=Parvibium lacunae TaxID=1888893 RepID=A0A368KYC9_9BURK|nr:suppressor of fused domain protein [Parvibium lacunae]RCS56458.1 suppressor of fused domain protein [Parvibium lacunae]